MHLDGGRDSDADGGMEPVDSDGEQGQDGAVSEPENDGDVSAWTAAQLIDESVDAAFASSLLDIIVNVAVNVEDGSLTDFPGAGGENTYNRSAIDGDHADDTAVLGRVSCPSSSSAAAPAGGEDNREEVVVAFVVVHENEGDVGNIVGKQERVAPWAEAEQEAVRNDKGSAVKTLAGDVEPVAEDLQQKARYASTPGNPDVEDPRHSSTTVSEQEDGKEALTGGSQEPAGAKITLSSEALEGSATLPEIGLDTGQLSLATCSVLDGLAPVGDGDISNATVEDDYDDNGNGAKGEDEVCAENDFLITGTSPARAIDGMAKEGNRGNKGEGAKAREGEEEEEGNEKIKEASKKGEERDTYRAKGEGENEVKEEEEEDYGEMAGEDKEAVEERKEEDENTEVEIEGKLKGGKGKREEEEEEEKERVVEDKERVVKGNKHEDVKGKKENMGGDEEDQEREDKKESVKEEDVKERAEKEEDNVEDDENETMGGDDKGQEKEGENERVRGEEEEEEDKERVEKVGDNVEDEKENMGGDEEEQEVDRGEESVREEEKEEEEGDKERAEKDEDRVEDKKKENMGGGDEEREKEDKKERVREKEEEEDGGKEKVKKGEDTVEDEEKDNMGGDEEERENKNKRDRVREEEEEEEEDKERVEKEEDNVEDEENETRGGDEGEQEKEGEKERGMEEEEEEEDKERVEKVGDKVEDKKENMGGNEEEQEVGRVEESVREEEEKEGDKERVEKEEDTVEDEEKENIGEGNKDRVKEDEDRVEKGVEKEEEGVRGDEVDRGETREIRDSLSQTGTSRQDDDNPAVESVDSSTDGRVPSRVNGDGRISMVADEVAVAVVATEVIVIATKSAKALEALGIAARSDLLHPADLRSLSTASLELCTCCRREGRTFHVRVTTETPLHAWSPLICSTMAMSALEAADGDRGDVDPLLDPLPVLGAISSEVDRDEGPGMKANALAESSDQRRRREGLRARSRVPALHVSHITWDRPDQDLREEFAHELPRNLETLTFGFGFNRALDSVIIDWPPRIKALHFSATFNPRPASGTLPTRKVSTTGREGGAAGRGEGRSKRRASIGEGSTDWAKFLPLGVEEISFGTHFNQPVENVQWPPGLKRLQFGANFKQEIEAADWPDTLEEITFGSYFNQSVEYTHWPSSLKKLTFGNGYNQPIEKCRFPSGFEEITFGTYFNHVINAVRWPPTLKRVTFGDRFNHPVVTSAWPASLTRLTFGRAFNQPLPKQSREPQQHGQNTWPPVGLECVIVGSKFSGDAVAAVGKQGEGEETNPISSRGGEHGEKGFSIVRRASPRRNRRRNVSGAGAQKGGVKGGKRGLASANPCAHAIQRP